MPSDSSDWIATDDADRSGMKPSQEIDIHFQVTISCVVFFFKRVIPGLFFLFLFRFVFSTQLTVNVQYKFLWPDSNRTPL